MTYVVSSGGLAVKHSALGANGHQFEPSKRSKLFQRLISRLTTSWVAYRVKWRCRLHWIKKNKWDVKKNRGRKVLSQWPTSGYFGCTFRYCSPVIGGGGGFSTTPTFRLCWISDSLGILPEQQKKQTTYALPGKPPATSVACNLRSGMMDHSDGNIYFEERIRTQKNFVFGVD